MTTRVVLDIKSAILAVHVRDEVNHGDDNHIVSSELQGTLLFQLNKVILTLRMLVINRLNSRASSTVAMTLESCP
jgi:hypothetical protein